MGIETVVQILIGCLALLFMFNIYVFRSLRRIVNNVNLLDGVLEMVVIKTFEDEEGPECI